MAMRGRLLELDWASRQSIWKSRAMGAKCAANWARSKSKLAASNSTRVRKRLDSSSPCSSLNRMLPLWRKMKSAIEATTPLRSGQETRRMAELCIKNFGSEGSMLPDLDCWIVFDILFAVAAVVGNLARHKIDIVADNAGAPTGCQELGERTFPRLISPQRRDKSVPIERRHIDSAGGQRRP